MEQREDAGRIEEALGGPALDEAIEELRRTSERRRRWYTLTARIAQATTVQQIAEALVDGVAGGEHGGVVYFADGETLALAAHRGLSDDQTRRLARLSYDMELPLLLAIRERRAVFYESRAALIADFPHLGHRQLPQTLASVAAIPLLLGDEVLGGLALDYVEPHAFDDEERTFFQTLAQNCAVAVSRMRWLASEQARRAEAEAERERLARLDAVSREVMRAGAGVNTVEILARAIVPAIADWCVVFLAGEKGIEPAAVAHSDPELVRRTLELLRRDPVNAGALEGAAAVLRTGTPQVALDVTDDSLRAAARSPEHLAMLRAAGLTSYIIVPMRSGDRVIGCIGLFTTNESDRRFGTADVRIAEELALRASLLLEQARLVEAAEVARQTAERANDVLRESEQRLRFLALATAELNSSLDYAKTLGAMARLVVPALADWCAVEVVEDGRLVRLGVAHADPAKLDLIREVAERVPLDRRALRLQQEIVRSGEPQLVADFSMELLEPVIVDDAHRRVIDALGLRSYIGVPLRRGDRCIGVISLVMSDSGRHYTEADLELAMALADRAAVAVENARLFREREHLLTAERDARAEARAQRDRLESLFMQALVPIAVFAGPDHVYELANPIYRRIFHGKDVVGRSLADAMPELVEQGVHRILDQVYRTGERFVATEFPARIPRLDGEEEVRYFDFILDPIVDADGLVTGILNIGSEVTAQVMARQRSEAARAEIAASEERFRTLAESTTTIVWTLDGSGARMERVEGWATFTGLDPQDAGREAWRAIHPDDADAVRQSFRDAHIAGRPWVCEFRVRRADGVYVPVESRAVPVRSADGTVREWVGSSTDITERRAADEERERLLDLAQWARAQAESASRAKDEFLAMLGHELRNPLAPIVTALQLMRLRSEGGPRKEQEIIERQVSHLIRLVDDLLDVSRVARGKVELKRAPADLAGVVANAVEMTSPLLEQRLHRLIVDVPKGIVINGDATRLAQVFANILSNAAKYTDAGGRIELRAQLDGQTVITSVRDNGVGIDAELLPHIFDAFVQGRRSFDRGQGGLGLGLALVRSLVELHGGEVWATSHGPGQGSELFVRLPVYSMTEEALARPVLPFAAGVAPSARHILVVDDNVDAAETLAALLRTRGDSVAVAFDGPQALQAASRQRPQVAVLDIGLPVMDGYELAGRLRAIVPDGLYLIALTGYGQEHDRERSAAAGFDEHLVKPVDPERLFEAIARNRA